MTYLSISPKESGLWRLVQRPIPWTVPEGKVYTDTLLPLAVILYLSIPNLVTFFTDTPFSSKNITIMSAVVIMVFLLLVTTCRPYAEGLLGDYCGLHISVWYLGVCGTEIY